MDQESTDSAKVLVRSWTQGYRDERIKQEELILAKAQEAKYNAQCIILRCEANLRILREAI